MGYSFRKRRIILVLLVLTGSQAFGATFNFTDFYEAPFLDSTITIPPAYSTTFDAIAKKLYQLQKVETKQEEEDHCEIIAPAKVYVCAEYAVEYGQDGRRAYYRDELTLRTEKPLKYGISKNITSKQLKEILRDEKIRLEKRQQHSLVTIQYEDRKIAFSMKNDKLEEIYFLIGF